MDIKKLTKSELYESYLDLKHMFNNALEENRKFRCSKIDHEKELRELRRDLEKARKRPYVLIAKTTMVLMILIPLLWGTYAALNGSTAAFHMLVILGIVIFVTVFCYLCNFIAMNS